MSDKGPSRVIKLYGTEIEDIRGRELTAGDLTVELDNGALRYVRLTGVEVLRGIAFLVRDENWGTFPAHISDLEVTQDANGFRVRYQARCGDDTRELSYAARIEGKPDGSLLFEVVATPQTDFLTNRTGFVVLHPIDGCAGCAVEVEHVDGTQERAEFPRIINPLQPFLDIRALTHTPIPGVHATCRMSGDTFEMEDHRNWTDASYKTYSRPLALPWPYKLEKDEPVCQSVNLSFAGSATAPVAAAADGEECVVEVRGAGAGTMPGMGIGVPAAEAGHALSAAPMLRELGVRRLVCQFDPRQGHDKAELSRCRQLADQLGAEAVLEIVLPCRDDPRSELMDIRDQVAASGLRPAAIEVSPAADLKAVLPGSKLPDVPPLADIYAAARAAFPGVTLGGGTFAFFTELNRKRPPPESLDFLKFTTGPITHAPDDRSVMETLSALPYVTRSVKAFIAGKPYRVGPSGIGARDNPYGAAVTPNPDNQRLCLAEMDPRQRGLFGAAWTLGYVAAFAAGGAAGVTLNAPTGPRGLVYRKTEYPQPYFDQADTAQVYPAFHIVSDLAGAAGCELLDLTVSDPSAISVLGCRRSETGATLWLANLGDKPRKVCVSGLPVARAGMRRLDEDSFEQAVTEPVAFRSAPRESVVLSAIHLQAYSVVRLEIDGE